MPTYQEPPTGSSSQRSSVVAVVCAVLAVAGLAAAGYERYDANRQEKALRAQIEDLNKKVSLLPTALVDGSKAPTSGSPSGWISYTGTAVSFEYPNTAIIINPADGTFQYGGVTYSIVSVSAENAVGVTDWMAAKGIKIEDTDPAQAGGHPAYTLKANLTTYFKVGASIYVVTAQKNGRPVAATTDPVYAHLLTSVRAH